MTIQIPDELAHNLEDLAASRQMSVEDFTVGQLQSLFQNRLTPSALFRVLQELPHPSPGAVDDMEAAIAAGRLPVRDQGIFDE